MISELDVRSDTPLSGTTIIPSLSLCLNNIKTFPEWCSFFRIKSISVICISLSSISIKFGEMLPSQHFVLFSRVFLNMMYGVWYMCVYVRERGVCVGFKFCSCSRLFEICTPKYFTTFCGHEIRKFSLSSCPNGTVRWTPNVSDLT